jgi:hypothetical protein
MYISIVLSSGLIEVLVPNLQIVSSKVRQQSSMNNEEIRDAADIANCVTDFIYVLM